MSTLPRGILARSGIVGRTIARVGAKQVKFLSQKPFISEQEFPSIKDHFDEEVAEAIMLSIVKLRGTALKIAQSMSMETGFFSEALRRRLSESHYRVPPLNRAIARQAIVDELGNIPEKLFQDFDSLAFAAASLGQAHKALTFEGDLVSVKIQYPGVRESIISDFKMFKTMVLPAWRNPYVKMVMKEIEERLFEELDYEKEITNTRWFSQRIALPNVVVPKIFSHLSSPRVLTTEFMHGLHLDQWLETHPSKSDRNYFGQLVYDFCLHGIYELGAVHVDPNMGNYLFRRDRKLVVLDFGCVKYLTPELSQNMSQLMKAVSHGDEKQSIQLHEAFGMNLSSMSRTDLETYENIVKPFWDYLTYPMKFEKFDLAANPDYCRQGQKNVWKVVKDLHMRGFSTEFLFLGRLLYGALKILESMGAEISFRNPNVY